MNTESNLSSTNSNIELIKKEVANGNFQNAIELLMKQMESDEESRFKELVHLKNEITNLKGKVKNLEKINSTLLKEKNAQVVKAYSAKLIDMIDKNEFEDFKQTVEDHDYPIDEYITEEYEDLNHMNLLHYTIQTNKFELATYLIERGAEANVPDKEDKWTPIMYAIQKQNIPIIDLLLVRGAKINYKDIDGFTPLSVAVDTNNKLVIESVLKSKPVIDNPKEIIAMAEPYENQEIIELLRTYFNINK